jgi:hypothetical protein
MFLRRRPSSAPFVSGDTFRSLASHVWESERTTLKPSDLSQNDIIFCQADLVGSLNEKVLAHSDVEVTLLLGNSDQNHNVALVQSLGIRDKVHFFAQNLEEEIAGWGVLPIGLENAQLSQNGIRRWFLRSRKRGLGQNRQMRILSSFSIWTNPTIRNQALISLRRSPLADIQGQVSARKHHELLQKYAFVAAPPGNGIDTHRVWEAMYLGCVPIVLDSYLMRFYDSLGLPIMVIRDFAEIENWTESVLRDRYSAMQVRFASEYLWVENWWKVFVGK